MLYGIFLGTTCLPSQEGRRFFTLKRIRMSTYYFNFKVALRVRRIPLTALVCKACICIIGLWRENPRFWLVKILSLATFLRKFTITARINTNKDTLCLDLLSQQLLWHSYVRRKSYEDFLWGSHITQPRPPFVSSRVLVFLLFFNDSESFSRCIIV